MDDPAASRHTLMLSRTILVCCVMLTSGIFPVRRSTGGWPETKTNPPARTTAESGIPSFFRCLLIPGISMISFFITVSYGRMAVGAGGSRPGDDSLGQALHVLADLTGVSQPDLVPL